MTFSSEILLAINFLVKSLKIYTHSVKIGVIYIPAPNVKKDTVIPSKAACAVTLHYHLVLSLLESRNGWDGWVYVSLAPLK